MLHAASMAASSWHQRPAWLLNAAVALQGQEMSDVQQQLEAALAEGSQQRLQTTELRAEMASVSAERTTLQQQVNARNHVSSLAFLFTAARPSLASPRAH